jgi:hypothetical protein
MFNSIDRYSLKLQLQRSVVISSNKEPSFGIGRNGGVQSLAIPYFIMRTKMYFQQKQKQKQKSLNMMTNDVICF